MTTENNQLKAYNKSIDFPIDKTNTNNIRLVFSKLSSQWKEKLHNDLHTIFSSLDDFYQNNNNLANNIRNNSIENGVNVLANYGIFEISDNNLYKEFIKPYDSWDDDMREIDEQYEAIIENSSELDAHRTARRQNRRQWIGYGSEESIYAADGKNLASNLGHGIFNLMAKGITSVGESIKKNEIFKRQETLELVINSAQRIIEAAYKGTLDAINTEKLGLIYDYTQSDIEKSNAIIDNIKKSRIPEENILSSLIRAIELYPYNREIYTNLLSKFGGDSGNLDNIVKLLGISDLSAEKKYLIKSRFPDLNSTDSSLLESRRIEMQEYAKNLCYDDFENYYLKLTEAVTVPSKNTAIPAPQKQTITQRDNKTPLNPDLIFNNFQSNSEHYFYVSPNLPNEKISNFLDKYKFEIDRDQILLYFDDTPFGKGDNGVIIDRYTLYPNVTFAEKNPIHLTDIKEASISGFINKTITLHLISNQKFDFTLCTSNKGSKLLFDVIQKILEAQKQPA